MSGIPQIAPYSMPPLEILQLIIRFASSRADLPLSVPEPDSTSVYSLKRLIRKSLSDHDATRHLNLIYAGKLLRSEEALGRVIHSGKSTKGKEPVYRAGPGPPIYVHCSLGDILTPDELAEEHLKFNGVDASLRSRSILHHDGTSSRDANASQNDVRDHVGNHESQGISSLPQGFDRLLGTGWNVDDVASLRASFLAQLAHTHTPSNMPASNALRALEERWLDSTGPGGSSVISRGQRLVDDDEAMDWEDDEAAGMDDNMWGSMVGFFWPVAAWMGHHEDGELWSERRQWAVWMGLAINLGLGVIRLFSIRHDEP